MRIVTPGVVGRRYLPFIALAAVQVLLVAVAPSKGPHSGNSTNVAAGQYNGGVDANGNPVDANGNPVDANGNPIGGSNGGPGGAGGGAGGAGGAAGATGGGAGGPGGAGDNSKCDPKTGKQLGPTFYMPRCRPVFKGDNGAATMTGVSKDRIDYIFYVAMGNPQVNQILATQNLATNNEDRCEATEAFHNEINKRWELYGRHFNSLDGPGKNKGSTNSDQPNCHFPYFQGQCSLTPPDPPCERAEADVIASMKPAYVMAPVADPAFYNELAKKGIIVAGGESEPRSYHSDVSPYYYDVFMDGTRLMDEAGEYYCKKLANKPVKWAGNGPGDVMGFDGPGKPPPMRKPAVVYPSTNGDPTYKIIVDELLSVLAKCGTPGVKTYPYQSDINTAEQQSQTTVNALKTAHVTTVICVCDPIAPVFLTNTADANGYHPEHMLAGIGLIDYDLLGRLYNRNEWKNAFGPSQLTLAAQFEQSDASKAWQDSGKQGAPADKTSNLEWAYYSLMASSFEIAGPRPSPPNVLSALSAEPPEGGWAATHDPHYALGMFRGPSQWTFLRDDREVFWCANRVSEIDGKAGSYFPVNGGQRFDQGEWPGGDPQVFTQNCGV